MVWALKESQEKNRRFIPYGRLRSEIFYQGGLLNALKSSGVVSDKYLGNSSWKIHQWLYIEKYGLDKDC